MSVASQFIELWHIRDDFTIDEYPNLQTQTADHLLKLLCCEETFPRSSNHPSGLHFLFAHQNHRFSFEDHYVVLIPATRGKRDDGFIGTGSLYFDGRRDRIARINRCFELQRLAEVDCAGTRQVVGERG